MAEEEEPKKKEESAEEGKPEKKGSPVAGIAVVVLLLVAAGGGVFLFVNGSGDDPKEKPRISQEYAEVDLGSVSYNLPMGSSAMVIDRTFSCNPVLILNHKIEKVAELLPLVEDRKNYLRGIALEIISQKPPNYFRQPNVLELLSFLLRDRLNEWLGSTENGQVVIDRVIFTEFQMPNN